MTTPFYWESTFPLSLPLSLSLCRYVVGLVFGFEHLLLVAAVLLQWSIHPVPKWVRVALQRRDYLAIRRKALAAPNKEKGCIAGHRHDDTTDHHHHGN